MKHVILTCCNHPHLRWICKEIAVNGLGQYNGARNIFYLGTIPDNGDPMHCTWSEPECPCKPSELRFAPECEARFPVPATTDNSLLAVPFECITPRTKRWVLQQLNY